MPYVMTIHEIIDYVKRQESARDLALRAWNKADDDGCFPEILTGDFAYENVIYTLETLEALHSCPTKPTP